MTTITSLIPRYREFLRHEKALAAQSVTAYTSDLRALDQYLGLEVEGITPSHLRAYIRHMSKAGAAIRTIRRRAHSFGTFWRWLVMESIVSDEITRKIVIPRKPKTIAGWLTAEELRRFVEIETDQPAYDLMFRLQAWLGLRRGELLKLLVKDVSLEDHKLIIREAKGKQDRVLPIPPALIVALQTLIAGRDRGALVFTNDYGRRIQPEQFNRAFQTRAALAGLADRGVTSRWLRHTFITHQVTAGTPLNTIRAITGHIDMGVFSGYVHADPATMELPIANHVLNRGA